MITLEKLREDLQEQLEVDREIHSIEVRADTVEECLADAAVQLEAKIKDLEYEVIEKGFQGVMGLAKKPWTLRIYENPQFIKKKLSERKKSMGEDELEEENKIIDQDGLYFIRHFGDGIFLKVTLPIGNGRPVAQGEVLSELKRPDTLDIDEPLIKKIVKDGSEGEYKEIGHYEHLASGDAIFAVDIAEDEMQATITATAPSNGGSEISAEDIKQKLATQGVVAGISDEKINDFLDHPIYNMPYVVAEAVKPVDGRDAYIAYNFETDRSKLKLKETNTGQVNFKELNQIQNVVEGQPLAQKMLAQRGKGGKTIMGRYLEAKNGKDIPIPLGNNTKLDTDGCTVLATCNGEVLLVGNKITVVPVREEKGVNIKTGNISFMGTVIVRGNVEDGFNVKAEGNIEIFGSVGNCRIEAGGDIVISQGVSGRNEGYITTPKSIWAHHIENVKMEAGQFVVINDSIVNSEVTAMKKIILKGKRAQIVGGHLFATEEITAKNIGSPAGGVETILEVGIDPKKKKRLLEIAELRNKLESEMEDVKANIASLENLKKVRRTTLPPEKEEMLNNLIKRQGEIMDETEALNTEAADLEERLKELKAVGRVNASGMVYPGAKIYVRDEKDEVKTEVKSVSFYFEDGFVRRGKYDAKNATEDVAAPEGYS